MDIVWKFGPFVAVLALVGLVCWAYTWWQNRPPWGLTVDQWARTVAESRAGRAEFDAQVADDLRRGLPSLAEYRQVLADAAAGVARLDPDCLQIGDEIYRPVVMYVVVLAGGVPGMSGMLPHDEAVERVAYLVEQGCTCYLQPVTVLGVRDAST